MAAFECEDYITGSLQQLARLVPQEAAKASLKAAVGATTTLRRKVPKAKQVYPADLVPGWSQPYEFITVSEATDGAQLNFRTFYGDLTNPVLKSALTGAGQSYRFERERLDVHLKAPKGTKGRSKTVEFSQAPRLEQWAKDHFQAERRAILVDSAEQLAPYLGQIEAQARFSIYQDLSRIAVPAVAPKKIT